MECCVDDIVPAKTIQRNCFAKDESLTKLFNYITAKHIPISLSCKYNGISKYYFGLDYQNWLLIY